MESHTPSAEGSAFQLPPDSYQGSGTSRACSLFLCSSLQAGFHIWDAYDLALTPWCLMPLFDHGVFHTKHFRRPKHCRLFLHSERLRHRRRHNKVQYSVLYAFVKPSVVASSACVAGVTTAGGSAATLVYARHDQHANRIRQFGGSGARLGSRVWW